MSFILDHPFLAFLLSWPLFCGFCVTIWSAAQLFDTILYRLPNQIMAHISVWARGWRPTGSRLTTTSPPSNHFASLPAAIPPQREDVVRTMPKPTKPAKPAKATKKPAKVSKTATPASNQ